MSKRLIFGENAANAWYDAKDDDNDYKRLQLVPNSEALTENGYDSSKSDAAYKAAKYYVNMPGFSAKAVSLTSITRSKSLIFWPSFKADPRP